MRAPVLCDDDASSPFMCSPDSEVILGNGGEGRSPGAIDVYTVGALGREEVLEFKHPWSWGRRRPNRRVGDDREYGAPVTGRVLMKEDPVITLAQKSAAVMA